MTKSELRKIYSVEQKLLSAFERNQKSEKITNKFFSTFDLTEIDILHCFIAIKKFGEIDTSLIYERIWHDFPHIRTVVPRVNFQSTEIENLIYTVDTELRENLWRIFEPTESKLIETKKIDLVLVPLVAFDESGFRVGYGKGFYDKFLKNCRVDCLKVGLSFFAPVAKISDVQSFDVKLNFCVTPEKVWKF